MKVYAHRGYSGKYPENTMLAFREAEKLGCYGVEMDVQLSRDGQVVIIHDEKIDRTTDGTGNVRDYTLQELKQFNAAAVWNGVHGFQSIPSFEEYCQWAQDKDLVTNIEIKNGVFYYEGLEEKTLELVKKYGLEKKVVFSSYNHCAITLLSRLAPEIPVGALVEHEGLGNPGYYCHKYGFAYYHPGYKGMTDEDVADCKKYGVGINVYTINDMGALEKMYDWGCESVISNYPGVCLAWLKTKE